MEDLNEIMDDSDGEELYYFHIIEEETETACSNDSATDYNTSNMPKMTKLSRMDIDDICESIVYDIHSIYKDYPSEIESQLEMTMDIDDENDGIIPTGTCKENTANADNVVENENINISSDNTIEITRNSENSQTALVVNLISDAQQGSTSNVNNVVENENINISSDEDYNTGQQLDTDQTDLVVHLISDIGNTSNVDNLKHSDSILIISDDEDEDTDQATDPKVDLTNIALLKRPKNIRKIFPKYREKIKETIEFLANKTGNTVVNPLIRASHGYTLHVRDILRLLTKDAWLNDVIVQNYLSLLANNCEETLAVSTDWLTSFKRNKCSTILRWLKLNNLNEYNTIVMIINPNNNHWALLVIKIWDGSILYFDSLYGVVNMSELTIVIEFLNTALREYSKDPRAIRTIPECWQYSMGTCPEQKTTYDCGVFACTMARYFLSHKPADFTQTDIVLLRHRIAWELIKNEIIPFK